MSREARIRWRCRRGMLELDIILHRFIDHYFEQLDEHQIELFEQLLMLSDNDLRELLFSDKHISDQTFQPLLELLRQV